MRLKQTLIGLFLFVATGIILLSSPVSVQAAQADWHVLTDYSVREDGSMRAQHIFEVENKDADPTPKQLVLSTFGGSVRSVVADSQDSTKLSAEVNAQSGDITIDLPDYSGTNRKWSFTVSYESDVIVTLGVTQLLQVEPLSVTGASISSQTVSVSMDLGLGFAVQQGVEPAGSRVGIGSQILTYESTSGLFSQGLSYYFGEESLVTATYQANLKNDGLWWQTKQVVLPPDTNQQRVQLESISPQPSKISLDADGNMIAEYSLSPKREIVVTAEVKIGLNNLTYNLESKATPDQADEILKQRYTAMTESWRGGQLDVTVVDGASSIAIIRQLAAAAAATVQPDIQSNEFNASMRGGSLGVADLLTGELRSYGVPARVVVGRVLTDGAQLYELPENHAWVEAYVPESGWITVDPVQMARSDTFGTADVLHVSFALWGVSQDRPPVDLSGWTYLYADDELSDPTKPSIPKATITKSVLFPGISIMDVSVQLPEGQIVDGVAITGPGEQLYEYGSLAPLQAASIKQFQFGGTALSSESFQAGIIASGSFAELGDVVVSETSYLPFILLIILVLVVLFVLLMIRRRRRRGADPTGRTKDSYIMHEERRGDDIHEEDLLPDDSDHLEEPELSDDPEESDSYQQPELAAPEPAFEVGPEPEPLPPQPHEIPKLSAREMKQQQAEELESDMPAQPAGRPVAQLPKLKGASAGLRIRARSVKSDTIHDKPAPQARKKHAHKPKMVQG